MQSRETQTKTTKHTYVWVLFHRHVELLLQLDDRPRGVGQLCAPLLRAAVQRVIVHVFPHSADLCGREKFSMNTPETLLLVQGGRKRGKFCWQSVNTQRSKELLTLSIILQKV